VNKQQAMTAQTQWRRLVYPAVIFITIVYMIPLVILLQHSVTDPVLGWDNYARLLTQPGYLRTLGRTLSLAATSTALALLIGYPIAYVIATTEKVWIKRVLIICIAAPYLTSILIRTFAWQVLLGRVGLINTGLDQLGLPTYELLFNAFAVIVGLTHFLLPLMILPLVSVMKNIDLTLLRASASLGAGPATGFVRVFLPASMPGIEVGVVLCFVYGVGAFVTPALLGGNSGRMLGALIENAISQQADYGLAAAASILLAIGVGLVVMLFRWGMGGGVAELISPELAGKRTLRLQGVFAHYVMRVLISCAKLLDKLRISALSGFVVAYALIAGALILLPQLIAIPISFSSTRTLIFPPPGWSTQWYVNFTRDEWIDPLITSLQIALGTAVFSCLIGGLAAIGVSRGLKGKAANAVNVLMIFPLIFPTVVAAAAFFLTWLPLGMTDSKLGIFLAHLAISAPFVFIVAGANLRLLNPALERAAASLGAGTWIQLKRILLPLLAGGLATGTFFAFLSSFDEASIAIFLSGLYVKTLPRRMYEALSFESDPTIGVIAVITMVVTAAVILIATRYTNRKKIRHHVRVK
jgi:putative spermidine/putrescine transport system permease protein